MRVKVNRSKSLEEEEYEVRTEEESVLKSRWRMEELGLCD